MTKRLHKIISIFLGISIGIISVVWTFLVWGGSQVSYPVSINFLDPTQVEIQSAGDSTWKTLASREPLFETDRIRTSDLSELLFLDQNIIRLDHNTEITLDQIGNDLVPTRIVLHQGQIWVNSFKNEVQVITNRSRTRIKNATATLQSSNNQVDISVLKHYVYLDVLEEDDEKVLNKTVLPNYSLITIYEKKVNDNYASLSTRKLRKELRQNHLLSSQIEESDWMQNNLFLDAQAATALIDPDNFVLTPGDLWYQSKRSVEDLVYNLSLTKNKKLEVLLNRGNERSDELVKILLTNPDKIIQKELMADLEDVLEQIAEIDVSVAQEFIDEHYQAIAHVSALHPLYPLYEKLSQLQKDQLTPQAKKEFVLEQSFKYLNNIEDLYLNNGNKTQIVEQINVFAKQLTELEKYEYSLDEINDLRTLAFFLVFGHAEKAESQLLALNTAIEDLNLKIAQEYSSGDATDIKYEIIENQLILADQIVEKIQNFDLAGEYLNQNDVFRKVEAVPATYAFRDHLQEYTWMVSEKINNNLHSAVMVDGKEFKEYLQFQKKLSDLSSELDDGQFAFEKENTNQEESINKVQSSFAEIGIEIATKQIELIVGTTDKLRISDFETTQQTFDYIKYNLADDTIYELAVDDDQILHVAVLRTNLYDFLQNQSDNKIDQDDLIISGQISSEVQKEELSEENEIAKLIKEIIRKELGYMNISVPLNNIILADTEGLETQIRRANLINTEIVFDFTYFRETKMVRNIILQTDEDALTLAETDLALHQVPQLITDEYQTVQELKQAREQLLQTFANNQISLDKTKVEFTDEAYNAVQFYDGQTVPDQFTVSGSYLIIEDVFPKVTLAEKTYENTTFDVLKKDLKILQVQKLLKDNSLETTEQTEIIPSAVDGDRIMVNQVWISGHSLRFTLDLETQTALNILIDEATDLKVDNTLLVDLAANVEQVIAEALAEAAKESQESAENAESESTVPVQSEEVVDSVETSNSLFPEVEEEMGGSLDEAVNEEVEPQIQELLQGDFFQPLEKMSEEFLLFSQ